MRLDTPFSSRHTRIHLHQHTHIDKVLTPIDTNTTRMLTNTSTATYSRPALRRGSPSGATPCFDHNSTLARPWLNLTLPWHSPGINSDPGNPQPWPHPASTLPPPCLHPAFTPPPPCLHPGSQTHGHGQAYIGAVSSQHPLFVGPLEVPQADGAVVRARGKFLVRRRESAKVTAGGTQRQAKQRKGGGGGMRRS